MKLQMILIAVAVLYCGGALAQECTNPINYAESVVSDFLRYQLTTYPFADASLHAQMRRGASDEEMADFIRSVVAKKEERHHIGEPDFVPASRTMVHIGG